MKIALPVWEGRVSPVFDTARRLLLVDCDDAVEVARSEEPLTERLAPRRAARLMDLGANVLICGAISRPLASMLASYGIQVVPFVSGDAEEVLSTYLSGGLRDPNIAPRFLMPGCRRRRFRGHRGQRY